MIYLYVAVIVVIVLLIVFKLKPGSKSYVQNLSGESDITVYGANFCGWCKKQKDELEGSEYRYVDCTDSANKAECESKGVKAYPTIQYKNKEGKFQTTPGFKTAEKLKELLIA